MLVQEEGEEREEREEEESKMSWKEEEQGLLQSASKRMCKSKRACKLERSREKP